MLNPVQTNDEIERTFRVWKRLIHVSFVYLQVGREEMRSVDITTRDLKPHLLKAAC